MHYYEVVPLIRFGGNTQVLTYSFQKKITPGSLVSISIGNKKSTAIVLTKVTKPSFKTKPIEKIYDIKPLPRYLIDTAVWMSDYYISPLSACFQTILPKGILKKRRSELNAASNHKAIRKNEDIKLNKDQQKAVKQVRSTQAKTITLFGVTGSGKTRTYIALSLDALANGKSIIVLVPEITLTSQIADQFRSVFGNTVLLTHSGMTEQQRHLVWQECMNSDKPRIVIGPRSALFCPLKNLGLILVDESHDNSYKQDQNPKYHAIRAASFIASKTNAKVILGSATPSVVDYYTAEAKKAPIVRLPKPAINSSGLTVDIINQKDRSLFTKNTFVSDTLFDSLDNSLNNNRQSILFINRRGTARLVLCTNCGWQSNCPDCKLPLTFHEDKQTVLCHICNYQNKLPISCPECSQPDITYKGIGSKRIESEIKKLFPQANTLRVDKDNIKISDFNQAYENLYRGKIDIAIGTQMISKGLDIPRMDTVGVIQADSMLYLPDFQATERTFQLLYQVCGRSGRRENPGHSVIQTYSPEHPSIKFAKERDFAGFYQYELHERKSAFFPPFNYLLKISCKRKSRNSAIKSASSLIDKLGVPPSISVHGPAPAFHEHSKSGYTWQVVLSGSSRKSLVDLGKKIPSGFHVDIDPSDLL